MEQRIKNKVIVKFDIYVKQSKVANSNKRNRGVFAARSFETGVIVEIAPIILLHQQDVDLVEKTELKYFNMYWDGKTVCIGLGFASLYNHSSTPNVEVTRDFKNNLYIFTACQNIKKNSELFIDYEIDDIESEYEI